MEVYDSNRGCYIIKERESNGIGTAGFILSIITLILGWIPIFGWIIWLLGLIFSFAGLFRRPRGLAIAGFVVSLIDLICILFVFALIAAALGIAGAATLFALS